MKRNDGGGGTGNGPLNLAPVPLVGLRHNRGTSGGTAVSDLTMSDRSSSNWHDVDDDDNAAAESGMPASMDRVDEEETFYDASAMLSPSPQKKRQDTGSTAATDVLDAEADVDGETADAGDERDDEEGMGSPIRPTVSDLTNSSASNAPISIGASRSGSLGGGDGDGDGASPGTAESPATSPMSTSGPTHTPLLRPTVSEEDLLCMGGLGLGVGVGPVGLDASRTTCCSPTHHMPPIRESSGTGLTGTPTTTPSNGLLGDLEEQRPPQDRTGGDVDGGGGGGLGVESGSVLRRRRLKFAEEEEEIIPCDGSAELEGGGDDDGCSSDDEEEGVHRHLDYEKLCREGDEWKAMPYNARVRLAFRRRASWLIDSLSAQRPGGLKDAPSEESSGPAFADSTRSTMSAKSNQYRIVPRNRGRSVFSGLKRLIALRILNFTVWQLQTSWMNFLVVILIVYIILINLFAFVILGIVAWYHSASGAGEKECVTSLSYDELIGPDSGQSFGHNFEISFALSWTTFSTVGYGAVGPSGEQDGCWAVRYLCAFEALVGMLYFGFCGAVCFAKIGRYLAQAPATFSSTLCVQYGEGIERQTFDGGVLSILSHSYRSRGSSTEVSEGSQAVPYPVLEFRIINDRANSDGYEILDASIECMVAIHKNVAFANNASITPDEAPMVQVHDSGKSCEVPLTKRMFYKMNVTSDKHPYFKRIWYVRHTLDASSPLLADRVREEIRRRGCWPPEKNTHSLIRSSLIKFSHMIVTLNGTSNLSDNGVFAEKKYKFQDIHIGWQFAKLLYYTENKKTKERIIKVDLDLVHDILPQDGGGNEPLKRGR